MRIKMQCPDCGKWFTLQLSVKEAGEAHAHPAPQDAEQQERRPVGPESRVRSGSGGAGGSRRSVLLYRIAPILAVAALVLLWFFAIGPAVERSRSTLVEQSGAAAATESPQLTSAEATGETPSEPRETPAVPAVEEAPLELTLVAGDRCWVRVSSDGRVVSDLTMRAGERRSWRAQRSFVLDVGSGEDIEVILNGRDLGPAGKGSRVVEGLVVTSEGLSLG